MRRKRSHGGVRREGGNLKKRGWFRGKREGGKKKTKNSKIKRRRRYVVSR